MVHSSRVSEAELHVTSRELKPELALAFAAQRRGARFGSAEDYVKAYRFTETAILSRPLL